MNIALFDTHLHDSKEMPLDKILSESSDFVKYFLFVGTDYTDSVNCYHKVEKIDNCWLSVGLHPHYALSGTKLNDCIDKFNEFILSDDNRKIVSIGEIGLDYFYQHSDIKSQLLTLEKFLELGLVYKLPIIIHCRDKIDKDSAYSDCYNILKDYLKTSKSHIVLHCYTGNIYWAEKFLELDSYFGFTGVITFKKSRNTFSEIIKIIPMNRILLETDAPFLAPEPYRGKINSSKYLIEVAKSVANTLKIDLITCANITTQNAVNFYNVGL